MRAMARSTHVPEIPMRSPRLIAALALSAALVGCSSSGAQQAAATPPAKAPEAAAPAPAEAAPAETTAKVDRTVCKSIAPTGSRIARKVCRKQSEWEEMAREGRDAAGQVQRRGDQTVPPGG